MGNDPTWWSGSLPPTTPSARVAPQGFLVFHGDTLTAKYANSVFISEYGSWDRSPLSSYEVVFARFEDGRPVGQPETVAGGFYSKDQSRLYGAPMGAGAGQGQSSADRR